MATLTNKPTVLRKSGEVVQPDPGPRKVDTKQGQEWQGPHPFLVAHGFSGSIHSFNNRVDKAVNGYRAAYNANPSPGLVFDVVKSPKILDNDIPKIFRVPLDQRKVKPEQAHAESSWDGTGIHQRADGKIQPTNPLTAFHETFLHTPLEGRQLPSGPGVLKEKEFQKRYPTIPMGYSDFLPAGGKFWQDVMQANVNVKPITEALGNIPAKSAVQMAADAGGGQGYQELQAAEYGSSPAIPVPTENTTFGRAAKAGLKKDVTDSYTQAVDRNVTRQKWLQAHDPYGLFKGLPTTGQFDKNWMTAYSKWSRTPTAAYAMLQFQAKQNEFDPDAKGIHEMLAALKFKQDYVNSKKALPDKWMAQSMPLQFFSHHMYAFSLYNTVANAGGGKDGRALEKQFAQATKDWWNYTTKGIPAWQYMIGVGELQSGFREAKLLYSTMSGSWNQAIADGTGATTFLGQLPKVFDGMSTKQLADHVAQSLADNPDAVRMLGFGYLPENLTGKAKFWDEFGNFAIQAIVSLVVKGPGYFKFDETTPLAEIRAHPVVRLMTQLAHNNIKIGDLWEAEKIFGTRGAETFIAATAKAVQEGKLSATDFHNLATELAHTGRTELPDGSVITKPIMPQLYDAHMPKHVTTLKLREAMGAVKRTANQIEKFGLSHGGQAGSSAERFVRSLRGMLELASPEGKTVPIYHLSPGSLQSFILNNGLMPREEAIQAVSKFITARGRESTTGAEAVLKDVIDRFNEKYPLKKGLIPSPFEGLVDTEGRVNVNFPSKADRGGKVQGALNDINDVGRWWRQSILAEGALSLLEKHGTRDTAAALLGGSPLKEVLGRGEGRIMVLAKNDPELARYLGYTRNSITNADTVYSQSFKISNGTDQYNLTDAIKTKPGARNELAHGAAEYLRRQVVSDIYPAFLDYQKTGDLTRMTDEILRNPKLLGKMKKVEKLAEKQKAIAKDYGLMGHQLTLGGNTALREALRTAKVQAASEYAKMIAKRFHSIQEAGRAQGIGDLLGEVQDLFYAKPGMANKEVADYLLKHEVNVTVPTGEPQPIPKLERGFGQAIRWGMTPNRFWRQRMFDGLSEKYLETFTKLGYGEKEAAMAAVDAAKTQTQFHLLDFSNMLEFERKFRGFLPFFTKHRLFVKWLFTTFAQHPALVLPLDQISKHLDPYGRLNFHMPKFLGGMAVSINFMRLLFLTSETLPYSFPGGQFVPGLKNIGVASEFSRLDNTVALLYNWGTGKGYDGIVSHLDTYDQSRLNRYMAIFAMKWRLQHGLGVPVSEKAALDYAVARMAPQMAWNQMVSAPTVARPDLPSRVQKLSDQYDKLLTTNPNKAQQLLGRHPEIGLAFGTGQNWHVYNHNTRMWGLYDQYLNRYLKIEKTLGDKAVAGQTLTPEDYKKMHEASVWLNGRIEYLKRLDALTWNSETRNKGEKGFPPASFDPSLNAITQPGPWYDQYSHHLLGSADDLITLFGRKSFNQKDLHDIYGYDITTWTAELNDPNIDPATKAQIITKLRRVEGAQKITANTTFYSVYAKARTRYESELHKLYTLAGTQSGYAKAVTEYKARQLILQSYNNPKVKFDGKEVKVLPFAEFRLTTKTPAEVDQLIFGKKGMLNFSYSGMTFDQKQLIGMKTTPKVDEGWGVYNSWVADYQQQTGKEASSSVRDQLAVDVNRNYPGFFRDYKIAHLPKAFVLLYYAPKAFQGPYSNLWKQLVTAAAKAYDTNKAGWPNEAAQYDTWIKANWPKAFVQEYEAAGGSQFLQGLTSAWG